MRLGLQTCSETLTVSTMLETASRVEYSPSSVNGLVCMICGGGNVSDTDYNKRAGYLEEQAVFQSKDIVNGDIVPFTNVYERGTEQERHAGVMTTNSFLSQYMERVTSDSREPTLFPLHQLRRIEG